MMDYPGLRRLAPEEARELGRRGGLASGAARRKKRAMRQRLAELLSLKMSGPAGRLEILAAMLDRALAGDLEIFDRLRAVIWSTARNADIP